MSGCVLVGKAPAGKPPVFHNLRWESNTDRRPRSTDAAKGIDQASCGMATVARCAVNIQHSPERRNIQCRVRASTVVFPPAIVLICPWMLDVQCRMLNVLPQGSRRPPFPTRLVAPPPLCPTAPLPPPPIPADSCPLPALHGVVLDTSTQRSRHLTSPFLEARNMYFSRNSSSRKHVRARRLRLESLERRELLSIDLVGTQVQILAQITTTLPRCGVAMA